MLLEMKSLRSHLEISLLCLLWLFGASRGMPQPWGLSTDWQHCKNASQEIIQQLWKLNVKPLVLKTKEPTLLPKKIECEDGCDPESLDNNNMYCLKKISQGLHDYHKLLGEYFEGPNFSDLQSAVKKLLLLLQKDPDVTERIHQSKNSSNTQDSWYRKPFQQHTLWRLQSFAVVVARVFSHSAAVNEKI